MRFTILRAALAAAFFATIFFATTVSSFAGTLGIANDFNGFVFGNLSSAGQDTEGRLAVGGNMVATNYAVGSGGAGPAVPYFPPPNTLDTLVVGGNLTANNWQVFNGNAAYGGTLNGAVSFNCGGCHSYQGSPVDFNSARDDLESKSDFWGTLPTDASIVYDGFFTVDLTATHDGLNVFNVDPAIWTLTSNKRIYNAFPNATLLINVPGEHPTQSNGMKYNDSDANSTAYGKVLFNYSEALTLNISSMKVLGSVLAPYADLTISGGGINGVGVANNVLQINGGEFHNFTFTGDLPDPPVPEPTTAALLLGMLAGCHWLRQCRA